MNNAQNKSIMSSNKLNLQVGDTITFTNNRNYRFTHKVVRMTEKSCYFSKPNGHIFRESWNTVNSYQQFADFTVIKA